MVRRRDLLALAGGLTSAWDVVYLGNVVGGALVVAIVVMIAPALDVAEPRAFAEIAGELTVHRWPVIIAVGVRAGWLTGLLSWLVAAVQRSVARFLYVWPIATASGFAHLHHSIAGTVEVLVGAFVSRGLTCADFVRFPGAATVGNAIGGSVFVSVLKYSRVVRSGPRPD